MDWSAKIFSYCERGLDAGFWAEPLNAISNAGFLIAAAAAFLSWTAASRADRGRGAGPGVAELALIAIVGVVGIGSFLFHTFATRWAAIADVAPIGVFMICYLGYALRWFAGAGWIVTAVLLVVFVAALGYAETVTCDGRACLNGSVGYLPALATLLLIGVWLQPSGHPAARYLLAGAAVFAVSLTLRTLDRSLCASTALFGGRGLGTHFLWHLCNATLLYLLLLAAVRHGRPDRGAAAQ